MNDRVVDLAVIVATVCVSMFVGALIGGGFVDWTWRRTLERTGAIRKNGTEPTGAVAARAPVNTEVSAQRAITRESIELGADEIQARYKAEGHVIPRKQALEEAKRMLALFDPLGGAS